MISNKELNDALKKIGQETEGEAKFIELDDTINFNCKRCGNCCSNRSDIILNPFDIYKIAKELNITTKEVVEKYCIVHVGNNSGLPIVTLREDERKLCPFLRFIVNEGFGCFINNSKPGACIMHPIGVVRNINKTTGKIETQYFQVSSCDTHGTDVKIKVKDYIKPYLDNEKCHEAGNLLIHEPTKYIDTNKFTKCFIDQDEKTLKEKFSEEQIEIIKSLDESLIQMSYKTYMCSTIAALYNLDTNKSFMEQIDEVKEKVKDSCIKMLTIFRTLNLDFSSDDLTKNVENIEERMNEISQDFRDSFKKFCEEHDIEGEE